MLSYRPHYSVLPTKVLIPIVTSFSDIQNDSQRTIVNAIRAFFRGTTGEIAYFWRLQRCLLSIFLWYSNILPPCSLTLVPFLLPEHTCEQRYVSSSLRVHACAAGRSARVPHLLSDGDRLVAGQHDNGHRRQRRRRRCKRSLGHQGPCERAP